LSLHQAPAYGASTTAGTQVTTRRPAAHDSRERSGNVRVFEDEPTRERLLGDDLLASEQQFVGEVAERA
jgi:hypothetical protein